MSETKERVFDLVKASAKSDRDVEGWFAAELAELGLKYSGLDEISPGSALVLSAIFTFGELDHFDISKHTGIGLNQVDGCIETLEERQLVFDDSRSGKYKTTASGENACADLHRVIVTRKRFELKRELDMVERLYQQMSII